MRCGQFVAKRDLGKHFAKHLLEVVALGLVAVLFSTIWRLLTR
jgi:hypothetical protein